MPSDEAKALAAMLLGHYPGNFINEMNVLALADTLDRIGMDIAPEVVERTKVDVRRPPSSAMLYEVAREIRDEQQTLERAFELPAAEGVPMPEELSEKWRDVVDKVTLAKQRELDVIENDAVWENVKHSIRTGPRYRGVCDGTGKLPVEQNGELICPDCGTPVPDMEFEPMPPPEKRRSWRTGE